MPENKYAAKLGDSTPVSPDRLSGNVELASELVKKGTLDAIYYVNSILALDDSAVAFSEGWPVLVYDTKNTAVWRKVSPGVIDLFKKVGWKIEQISEDKYEFRR